MHPRDLITDAKSLYDILTKGEDPRPSDDGVLLWAPWLRGRLARGSARKMIWACNASVISGGLAKVPPDQIASRELLQTGQFHARHSSLCEAELFDPWKGLPPPKKGAAKDEATQAFLEQSAQADNVLLAL